MTLLLVFVMAVVAIMVSGYDVAPGMPGLWVQLPPGAAMASVAGVARPTGSTPAPCHTRVSTTIHFAPRFEGHTSPVLKVSADRARARGPPGAGWSHLRPAAVLVPEPPLSLDPLPPGTDPMRQCR